MRLPSGVLTAGLAVVTRAFAASAANTSTAFSTTTDGHDHLQPGGWVDYAISGVGVLILLVVVYFTVRWFVRPREGEADHIKRRILEGPKW